MTQPKMTRALAEAAAKDAANEQMRKEGRGHWNRHDYNLAVQTFERLWPETWDLQSLQ